MLNSVGAYVRANDLIGRIDPKSVGLDCARNSDRRDGGLGTQEAVEIASCIHVKAHDIALRIDSKRPGQVGAGVVDRGYLAAIEHECMAHSVRAVVRTDDDSAGVDPGREG